MGDITCDVVMFITTIVVVGTIILFPSFFEKRKK